MSILTYPEDAILLNFPNSRVIEIVGGERYVAFDPDPDHTLTFSLGARARSWQLPNPNATQVLEWADEVVLPGRDNLNFYFHGHGDGTPISDNAVALDYETASAAVWFPVDPNRLPDEYRVGGRVAVIRTDRVTDPDIAGAMQKEGRIWYGARDGDWTILSDQSLSAEGLGARHWFCASEHVTVLWSGDSFPTTPEAEPLTEPEAEGGVEPEAEEPPAITPEHQREIDLIFQRLAAEAERRAWGRHMGTFLERVEGRLHATPSKPRPTVTLAVVLQRATVQVPLPDGVEDASELTQEQMRALAEEHAAGNLTYRAHHR